MDVPSGDQSRDDAVDAMGFLSQSDNRLALLAALAEQDELDRDALVASLDASRRTVVRVVNEFEERGYVAEGPRGYRLTALGAHVARCQRAFVEGFVDDPEIREFLRQLPGDALPFDPARLADGTVVTASDGSRYAPLDRILALRADASRVRELPPGVERRSVQQLADRVRSGEEIEVEVVLSKSVVSGAQSNPDYAEDHVVIAGSDVVDLLVHPDPAEIPVSVVDETVVLVAVSDEEYPAILVTDDPVVREWAESTIDEHVAEAVPIEQLEP